jgi:hypothetical protein
MVGTTFGLFPLLSDDGLVIGLGRMIGTVPVVGVGLGIGTLCGR